MLSYSNYIIPYKHQDSEREFVSGSFLSVKLQGLEFTLEKQGWLKKKSCFQLCGDEIQ